MEKEKSFQQIVLEQLYIWMGFGLNLIHTKDIFYKYFIEV